MLPTESGAPLDPALYPRARSEGLDFRRAGDADLPLLKRVYESTRADELALSDWPETQKAAFLDMQFRAQHTQYRRNYPDADWLVLLHRGAPAGRLYLERWSNQHRIIDIALLPEHRGRGLGTALLLDLIDEAAASGKGVSIHVEKFNPAMRLYRRLGFALEEDKGVYDLMRREPGARSTGADAVPG